MVKRKKVYQTGKTHVKVDRRLIAKKPGLRKSSSGKKYTEYRRNRSDLNKRKDYNKKMKTRIIKGYSGKKEDIYNHKFTDKEYEKYSITKVKTLKRSRQSSPGSNYSYIQGKYKIWLKPRKKRKYDDDTGVLVRV